jgi:glutathionylspermidine synthase
MIRRTSQPRPDWPAKVESQGLHYHSIDGVPYWDESAYYEFSSWEIDELEKASYALNDLCLKALDHIFSARLFDRFGIPDEFVPWLCRSWDRDQQTLYGRFDFAYDGRTPPKLLEYNADTPTALLEAGVIQWYWLQDVMPGVDQYNSIHERLIEFWQGLTPKPEGPVHFLSQRGHLEDFMTVSYLRDVAEQAGLKTVYLPIEDVGWNSARRLFVDLDERVIRTCFKLYPWDWLLSEEYGHYLPEAPVRWFEPPWKMLLADKRILVLLWELFPDCPYLLRAGEEPWGPNHVRKPVGGREGANVTITANGSVVEESPGPYGDGPFIYQDLRPLREFDGRFPVLGCWMVNGYACGMGVREDDNRITRNTSRFVPHVFVK